MAVATQQMRLLIADTASPSLFTDEELQTYLDLWAGDEAPRRVDIFRASADVLEAIAISEVLIAKKIRTQDLSTDGPAVAEALRKLALGMRQRADDEDAANGGVFEIYDSRESYGQEGEESRYGSAFGI